MEEYKDLLLRFATGKESLQEREIIKNFVLKQVRISGREKIFIDKWEKNYIEDLLSDLRVKILELKETLESKEFINWSYFQKVVKSCIEEFHKQMIYLQEIPYENLKVKNKEDELEFEESILFSCEMRPEEDLENEEFYCSMLEIIDDKDYPIICYYLCKESNKTCKEPEDISKNNLYKRWERLKKRINEKLPYRPSESEMKYFYEKFMSEICEKLGYIK